MKTLLALSFVSALALLSSACSTARSPATAQVGNESANRMLAPDSLGSIGRLHTFGDVYLASQPEPADFEQAKADGVKTVLNLRPAAEQPDFDEHAWVEGLGLTYLNLPIAGAGGLDDEAFARARELLNTAERPILVHCASANRVGALWVPWRVLDGGVDLADALAEARTIGLKSQELEAKARDYVMRQQRTK